MIMGCREIGRRRRGEFTIEMLLGSWKGLMGLVTLAQSKLAVASADKFCSKRRNRVPFLSRLVGSKRKDHRTDTEIFNDTASEHAVDSRPEGADAQPFSQPVDNFGYSPKSPLPPSYIKIRAKNRKGKADFDRIFLAQQLETGIASSRLERRLSDVRIPRTAAAAAVNARAISAADKQPVWTMEFSKDGRYLAAAGQSRIIRVWAVLSTPEERRAHEKAEHRQESYAEGERLSAPVFHQKVYREFVGHLSTVLDLSWSKVCNILCKTEVQSRLICAE